MINSEVYIKFRLSIDNGFRNEFSYVHYRKWGQTELWDGGRFSGPPPQRQNADTCIEIWFNWELVGKYKSYCKARNVVNELLKLCPASMHELEEYLTI